MILWKGRFSLWRNLAFFPCYHALRGRHLSASTLSGEMTRPKTGTISTGTQILGGLSNLYVLGDKFYLCSALKLFHNLISNFNILNVNINKKNYKKNFLFLVFPLVLSQFDKINFC